MITRNAYRKKLDRLDSRLVKQVAAYRKDPDEKNVHDLRTATRRLLAAIQLLPKHIRKKKRVVKYVEAYEKLMKLNAETRDLDIIISKIVQHENGMSRFNNTLEEIKQIRKDSLTKGLEFASTLKYNPRLAVQLKQVSNSDLEKRLDKMAKKYWSKIRNRIRIVLKDPSRGEELHLLREDARKLRYVLDMGSGKKIAKQTMILKSWQDQLGAIHDSDIFILRLETMDSTNEIESLLKHEKNLRNVNYEKFRSLTSNWGGS